MDGWIWILIACLILLVVSRVTGTTQSKYSTSSETIKTDAGELIVQRWVARHQEQNDSVKTSRPKTIGILCYGTRGDVQPFIALALELQKLQIRTFIAAPKCFKSLIEEHKIPFRYGGVDTVDQPKEIFANECSSFSDVLTVLNRVYLVVGQALWDASHDCDMIIGGALTRSLTIHIAEARKIPCFCTHFVGSDVPTRAFPPPDLADSLSSLKTWLPFLAPHVNKFLYTLRGLKIIIGAVSSGLAKSDEGFRKSLGLPKADPLLNLKDAQEQPSFHAYSPQIQAKPHDWPENVILTGYWTVDNLDNAENLQSVADMKVRRFINKAKEDKRKVVFATFGSMELVDDVLLEVVDAAKQLDCRVIVQRHGAGDFVLDEEQVLVVSESLNHKALFPFCDCVVHHGGAGTTSTALYAACPSVIVPILHWSDQPFWAAALENRHCGRFVPRAKANATTLAEAISTCLSSPITKNAKDVAEVLKSELPGARNAAFLLQQYLSLL